MTVSELSNCDEDLYGNIQLALEILGSIHMLCCENVILTIPLMLTIIVKYIGIWIHTIISIWFQWNVLCFHVSFSGFCVLISRPLPHNYVAGKFFFHINLLPYNIEHVVIYKINCESHISLRLVRKIFTGKTNFPSSFKYCWQ